MGIVESSMRRQFEDRVLIVFLPVQKITAEGDSSLISGSLVRPAEAKTGVENHVAPIIQPGYGMQVDVFLIEGAGSSILDHRIGVIFLERPERRIGECHTYPPPPLAVKAIIKERV